MDARLGRKVSRPAWPLGGHAESQALSRQPGSGLRAHDAPFPRPEEQGARSPELLGSFNAMSAGNADGTAMLLRIFLEALGCLPETLHRRAAQVGDPPAGTRNAGHPLNPSASTSISPSRPPPPGAWPGCHGGLVPAPACSAGSVLSA